MANLKLDAALKDGGGADLRSAVMGVREQTHVTAKEPSLRLQAVQNTKLDEAIPAAPR
jgi:hypothetical protein